MSHYGMFHGTYRRDQGLTVSPTLFDNLVKPTPLLLLDIHSLVSDRVSLLLCLVLGLSLVHFYKVSLFHECEKRGPALIPSAH